MLPREHIFLKLVHPKKKKKNVKGGNCHLVKDLQHFTGGSEQKHPQEKEMQQGKMVF